MRFFKSLFQKPESEASKNKPDNTELLALIEQYISDHEYESYKKVVLELKQGAKEGASYSITDLTGRTVATGALYGGSNTVNVHHLPDGVYILSINNNDKSTERTRFIKE